MSDNPLSLEEQARKVARKRADDLQGFMRHFGSFLAVGLFFLILNLITDRHSLWFFWPMLPWGVGLAIHGWNVLWNDRLFDDEWAERKARSIIERQERASSATKPPATSPASTQLESSEIIRQSAVLIDAIRTSAREIPKPDIRRQALSICASADQVLSAITDNPGEIAIARDFLDRYLRPASKIVGDYSRLSSRHIASAQPTLIKVEEHDLPLLVTKLDDLYDRLHRGSLIDLQVAREMLSLDVADWQDGETTSPGVSRAQPQFPRT